MSQSDVIAGSEEEEEFTEFAEAKSEAEASFSSPEVFYQTAESIFLEDSFTVPEYLQSLLQFESDFLYLTKSFSSLDETERKNLFRWLMTDGNPFDQETETTICQPFSNMNMPDDVFPILLTPLKDSSTKEAEQYFTGVFQTFVQKQVLELKGTPQPPDSLTIHLASALSPTDDSLQAVEVEMPKEIAHIKERMAKIPLPSLYGKTVKREQFSRTSIAEMLAAQRATSQVLKNLEDLQDSQETGYTETDLEDIPSPRNWQLFVSSEGESSDSSYSEEIVHSSKSVERSSQKEELYEVDLS